MMVVIYFFFKGLGIAARVASRVVGFFLKIDND